MLVLTPLLLQGKVIKESFRVADAEPRHHQVYLRAAMASDGRFAIAWVDSLYLNDPYVPDKADLNLFVRFFDRDGNPLGEAYKITKLVDTNWIYHPRLDMDSLGNTVLVCIDDKTESDEQLSNIRFQAFGPDGSAMDSAKTLRQNFWIFGRKPISLSLSNNGEFAVA